jgi:hypothetical protein
MRTATLITGSLLFLTLSVPAQLRAQVDSTAQQSDSVKVEAIRSFLDVTRTADVFLTGFEQAMADQPNPSDMPDGFLEAFQAKVHERTPEFIDMLVPLYDKHLSLEDLYTLIEFFSTPLGQRLVELEMDLATEIATLAERWAMTLVGEVFMELAKKPKPY